ncbi:uncharacterized protein LOC144295913 [Canis aureus]
MTREQEVVEISWRSKKEHFKKNGVSYSDLVKPWFMLRWRPSLSLGQSLGPPVVSVNLFCVVAGETARQNKTFIPWIFFNSSLNTLNYANMRISSMAAE